VLGSYTLPNKTTARKVRENQNAGANDTLVQIGMPCGDVSRQKTDLADDRCMACWHETRTGFCKV
jgi:hypothetical protein